MDKYVVRTQRALHGVAGSEDYHIDQSSAKRPRVATTSSQAEISNTVKMRQYKSKLKYNPEWGTKWRWMEYDEHKGGMFYSICKKYGKQPVVARGVWVSRPVNNWVKATELLSKHAKSEWH